MKPMGRRTIKFPSKTDCHPRNGYVNWWENEVAYENKKAERRDIKKNIEEEINNYLKEKESQ